MKYKDQVRTVAVDVTDPAAVRSAVQTAIAAFGRLDVLVNNAGYGNIAAIEDITAEDLRVQMETNFYGVVNVTRAALPLLREQRSGHIIQISSIGVVLLHRGATFSACGNPVRIGFNAEPGRYDACVEVCQ